MQSIEPSAIIVENRQRKDLGLGDLGELANSIRDHGLFHAIILQTDNNKLVAGERRLEACKIIINQGDTIKYNGDECPPGHVPHTRISSYDPLAIQEIELEENLCRLNLSWQEETQTKAAIHKLRLAQNPSQTLKQTAAELAQPMENLTRASANLSNDLLLVEHLNNPRVKGAKTREEAIKRARVVSKENTRIESANLINQIQFKERLTLLPGETVEQMQTLPDRKFDVILTDPPYGIGAQSHGDMARNVHHYDDSPETWLYLMNACAEQWDRVSKEQAHLYIFCAFRNFARLKDIVEDGGDSGWNVWSRPLIWYKGNQSMLPSYQYGPRKTYECILYANRGKKILEKVDHDVINIPQASDLDFAAQKPVELYTNLLARSCKPGDHVLDNFAGRGTIFKAAKALSLYATGIEEKPNQLDMCQQAMEEES